MTEPIAPIAPSETNANDVTSIHHRSIDPLCQHYDRFRQTMMDHTSMSNESNDRDHSMNYDRVRDGDHVLLHFADGRQIFAHCTRRKKSLVRIQKRSYPTDHLIGLPYGTILEQEAQQLIPILDPRAKLIPELNLTVAPDPRSEEDDDDAIAATKDNRSLVDTNTAQRINYNTLMRMRQEGMTGASIVASMVDNSTTFQHKTAFAQNKYVLRKQIKHQPRCRLVRCHAASIIEAWYLKDPKRIRNLRDDTVGQILSYANVAAGRRVLILESCLGLVMGAVAQRMGGYGLLFSLYEGQQPSAYMDMLEKFNLSFAEMNTIKWVHCGDVFTDRDDTAGANDTNTSSDSATNNNHDDVVIRSAETTNSMNDTVACHGSSLTINEDNNDLECLDRDALRWPCPLQSHTRQYLERQQANGTFVNGHSSAAAKAGHTIYSFLCKRAARFARKLCRHTSLEAQLWLQERPCDSLILASRYDPTETLLQLFPHLAPSCPFVIYSEFIEPLTHCFRAIQENPKLLSINLRLSDTWMREYQVLEGRTHPNMNMSQSGGFILTGIKLDPTTGQNELEESVLKEIREQIGGRRARQKKKVPDSKSTPKNSKQKKQKTHNDM